MKRPTFSFLVVLAPTVLAACRPPAPVAVPAVPTPPPAPSAKGGDLLKRSHFGDGRSLPWMPLYIDPARGDTAVDSAKGAMCLNVAAAGKNPWDVQLRHREMTIRKGHTYTI